MNTVALLRCPLEDASALSPEFEIVRIWVDVGILQACPTNILLQSSGMK